VLEEMLGSPPLQAREVEEIRVRLSIECWENDSVRNAALKALAEPGEGISRYRKTL
jgi:hypothetical protein